MLRKFKPFENTDHFQFQDPDSGYIHRGKDRSELYRNIVQYRLQNQLEPVDHLNQVVENYLCGLPENTNKCCPVELARGFFTIVKGGVALVKSMIYKTYVSQEIAEKRASQCVGCENNYFPDRGPFISWIDEIAVQTIGELRVSKHDELGECAVCQCPLRSKVFYDGKLDPFPEDQLVRLKAVKCWQIDLQRT